LRNKVKIQSNEIKNQKKKRGGEKELPSRKKAITNKNRQQRMTEDEYLKFCDVKIRDDFEQIKNKLLWETIGKEGDKPPHWVKLKDCDNTHLRNIIIKVKYIHPITKEVILSILHDRWCNKQKENDEKSYQIITKKIEEWEQKGYTLEIIDKIIKNAKTSDDNKTGTTIHIGTIDITDNKNGVMIKRNSKNK